DPTDPTSPGTPIPPGDLGDDPLLDQYAADCYAGDMEACDDLYWESPIDSAYEEYGDTCAGRATEPVMSCTDLDDPVPGSDLPADTGDVPVDTGDVPGGELPPPTLEPTGLGDDPELDALAEECYQGDMGACDELYDASPR